MFKLILSIVAPLGFALVCTSSSAQTVASGAKPRLPTVVLVHGAFADSSSWNDVTNRLLSRNYPVIALANPLRGLKSDACYVADALTNIDGPVVLVGHSYGGAVITDAALYHDNVKALVYVAAFAPDLGESGLDLTARFPGSTLGPTLTPPVALHGGEKDLYIQREKFRAQFAADVPEGTAALMCVTQRPIIEAALDEAAGMPAWKKISSWFIFGQLDKNIPAAAHIFMARRAGAKQAVEIKGASHVVMVSHPDEVAAMIESAAGSF